MTSGTPKDITWVSSSLEDLKGFPDHVKQLMGFALFQAQCGRKHLQAKPLRSFKGGGVLEVVEDFDGNAFRTMYTVRYANTIYVLHAFQKKSRKRIETPKHEIDVVRSRLRIAEELHQSSTNQKKGEPR